MADSRLKTQSTTDETTSMMRMAHSYTSSSTTAPLKLSKGEIEDLREAFRLFDVEGKGVISFQDLKEVAESLALEHGNKENALSTQSYRHLSDLLNSVSYNNQGEDDDNMELDEERFIQLLSHRHENETSDEFQRVFDLLDRKGKGFLTIQDLRHVSEELGETMTDEELEEMIAKAAPTNGKVTPEDFRKIMTRKLFS